MAVFQDSAVMCCTVGPMGSSSINMRGYSMMLTLILMLMAWLLMAVKAIVQRHCHWQALLHAFTSAHRDTCVFGFPPRTCTPAASHLWHIS